MNKLIYYYTLEEAIKSLNRWDDKYKIGLTTSGELMALIMQVLNIPLSSLQNTIFDKPIADTLICEYIYKNFQNVYVLKTENELNANNEDLKELITNIVVIYSNTYLRYSKLIQLYDDEKDNLLNKIKVNTLSRFNDTPQDMGNFGEDEHTTNATITETASDGATILTRLEEVYKLYNNMFLKWCKEFNKIVISFD